MYKLMMAVIALGSFACGTQESVETTSSLDALYAESSIGNLGFGVDGNRVYLTEGNKALPWAHSAPTLNGTKIVYQNKVIGDTGTGYFCNGQYDAVCDASLYKNRPSSITIKNAGSKTAAPQNPNNLKIINADTRALAAFKVSTPVNGIAKGSCRVASSSGAKTLPITVEKKIAKDQNNAEISMLEVKTPIYKYNQQTKQLNFVQMKVLQRVYGNGAVQNVQGKPAETSTEVQGLLRLFQ